MMGKAAPVLLYACSGVDSESWLAALRHELPQVEIRVWPDAGRLEDITMAYVWRHPPGLLSTLPNLRAVFCLGAGVESILLDPQLPQHVPLVRMVDPSLATGMKEFVLMSVLHYHRQMPGYAVQQQHRQWQQRVATLPRDRRVGILGLGELGGLCAGTLAAFDFDVAGWSRTPRAIDGVENFTGLDQLAAFLQRSEILVCLLPLTPETANIINRETLALLPRGAFFINVARGRHVVDADLIAALDAGHLEGATLDVFREEPLPPSHPYWSHPKVRVLPHISAITQIKTAAPTLAANINRLLSGQPLQNVVDIRRGY